LEWQLIVTLVVSPLLGVAGGLLKDLLQGRRERGTKEIERDTALGSKQIEHDATLEAKRLDDASAIRRELREQVAELSREIKQVREEHEQSRVHITDLQIALRRFVSRVEECVTVINQLLEAEAHLDEGHVRRARAILKLIENDRAMRRQILEEVRPDVVG
jgi:vacuolar-type H+-ATPase subunit I/STV1